MNIGVLTSSRADYGIYRPLLKQLHKDPSFSVKIIAFGTHVSRYHGYTLEEIEKDGFNIFQTVNSLLINDEEDGIATSFSLTALKFSEFWKENKQTFDIVFCLGDRYEMFAAVSAGIPFAVPFAHLHGGETTLGAIDNIYRHCISLASSVHFVTLASAKERLVELLGNQAEIHLVGSLGLDNLTFLELLSVSEFQKQWSIDLSRRSVLMTFHPETRGCSMKDQLEGIEGTLKYLLKTWQVIVTMPNADTNGIAIRELYQKYKSDPNLYLIENFGTLGYFSCMKQVTFVIGNSSSGIIEAASLKKYVINVGERQKGRETGENVIHVPFIISEIQQAIERVSEMGSYEGTNIYGQGNTGNTILKVLKERQHV